MMQGRATVLVYNTPSWPDICLPNIIKISQRILKLWSSQAFFYWGRSDRWNRTVTWDTKLIAVSPWSLSARGSGDKNNKFLSNKNACCRYRQKNQNWILNLTDKNINAQQWHSQNVDKVTHIEGRLLYQAMILYNYVPFQIGTSLKGKNLLPKEWILSFKSSSLLGMENHFYHIRRADLELYYFYRACTYTA